MSQEEDTIKKTAEQAMDWARGSWGQGTYCQPPYDNDKMSAIYTEMAKICQSQATFFATR